ncbi:MAG: Wzz/FepE/Etk N-terminal domain-containing protein [Mucinivorans sp.]
MENKEKEIDLVKLFKKIWTQKMKVVKWGVMGAIIGVVIAISIPKKYETVVSMAPEGNKTSTSSSMSGLAAMAGFNIGGNPSDGVSARLYPQVISSAPFLLEFANIEVEYKKGKISLYDYITKEQKSAWWSAVIGAPMQAVGWAMGLFADKKTGDTKDTINIFKPSSTQQAFVGALNGMINVEPDKKNGILTITTTMQDPLIAAVVADSIVVKLQRYMTAYRTSKTRADLEQNLKMRAEARAKYYRADSLYAASMDRNQNLILRSAGIQVARLADERELAFTVYQQLATQVEMSKIKLQEDMPIATIIEPASVAIRASSPKKMMILVAFAFLGAFAAIGVIVVKEIANKKDEE